MKKMFWCLQLSTSTFSLVAHLPTAEIPTSKTTPLGSQETPLTMRHYAAINQSTDLKAIIDSIETRAKKQENYGNIPYQKEQLIEALNEKFINNPTLTENLPHVVAILLTKKNCQTSHALENTLTQALLDASEKTNHSFGEQTQQNIHFEVPSDGKLPEWLASFIRSSGYSVENITLPCLMYMTYLKDTHTNEYRWSRLDMSNPVLKEPMSAVTRANLIYDTYLDKLPDCYQAAFPNNKAH